MVGVAHFPALQETVGAALGHGCIWNGRPAQVSGVRTLGDSLVLTTDPAGTSPRAHGPRMGTSGPGNVPGPNLGRLLRPHPGGHRQGGNHGRPDPFALGCGTLRSHPLRGGGSVHRPGGDPPFGWRVGNLHERPPSRGGPGHAPGQLTATGEPFLSGPRSEEPLQGAALRIFPSWDGPSDRSTLRLRTSASTDSGSTMGCQIWTVGKVVRNHRTLQKNSPRKRNPIAGSLRVMVGSPS